MLKRRRKSCHSNRAAIAKSVTVDSTHNAGAPEIEVTPEMINAGLKHLDDIGLTALTTQAAYPEFVIEFYRAVVCAKKS